VLPPLGDELLLLLLQPAAAKAIAARPAIAVVRFIIFIFLSLDLGHPAAVKHAFWPASGCMPWRQLKDGRLGEVLVWRPDRAGDRILSAP